MKKNRHKNPIMRKDGSCLSAKEEAYVISFRKQIDKDALKPSKKDVAHGPYLKLEKQEENNAKAKA